MKIERNQFTQLWARQVYNFEKSLIIFTEHLQEQTTY